MKNLPRRRVAEMHFVPFRIDLGENASLGRKSKPTAATEDAVTLSKIRRSMSPPSFHHGSGCSR